MDASPAQYLFSTLDKCCSTHFGWNYNSCMGLLDLTCSRALWYPDWEGENKGCKRDGNEPLYMIENPTTYMFSSKSDCCNEHYTWNLPECMGSSTSGRKYYPDWSGDDTCKADGDAPKYMLLNPTLWLYSTLSECCSENYSWKLNECLGSSDAGSASLYYPDWSGDNDGCINDGDAPEYMVLNPSLWLHTTLQSCCEKNYSYILSQCIGSSVTGSDEWYMDYAASKCVKDCDGASPCGGLSNGWDEKYPTQDTCCNAKMWWDFKACNA